MSDSSLLENYRSGDYTAIIDHFEKRETHGFSAEELYLLVKTYYAAGKKEQLETRLKQLETKIPEVFSDILIYEKIKKQVAFEEQGEYLAVWPEYIADSKTNHNIQLIAKILTEKALSAKDKRILRQVLDSLVPYVKAGVVDLKLLEIYADVIEDSDPKKNDVMISLWTMQDVYKLSEKQRKIEQKVLTRVNGFQPEIVKHFVAQKKYKNYKYLTQKIPKYLSLLTDKSTEGYKTLSDLYIYALKRLRQYSQTISELNRKKTRDLLAISLLDARLLQFELLLRKGKEKEAIALLTDIRLKHPDYNANRQYLQLAGFNFRKGRLKQSLGYYQQIDLSTMANGSVTGVKWKIWRIHYQLKNRDELVNLSRWAETYVFENAEVAAKFCYWSAKLKLDPKISQSACYQRYPLTYYGLHSKASADSRLTPVKMSTSTRAMSKPKVSKDRLAVYSFLMVLYNLDEKQVADGIAKSLINTVKGEELLFLADLLLKVDRYYLVQLIMESYFRDDLAESLTARSLLLPYFYPKAYLDQVTELKPFERVSELLVFSVMREESHFNPEVESIAGAVGLMQLMPPTAKYLAKLLKMRFKQDELTNPEVNLKLGTAYLDRLLKRYKGNIFYTLAAYNGGPTNVKRWQRKTMSADNDDFVENITFEETRNYVRRVMRSYYIYQDLYGKTL